MKQCPFCNTLLPDNSRFCPSCGKLVPSSEQNHSFEFEEEKSSLKVVLILLAVIVVIGNLFGLAIWLYLSSLSEDEDGTEEVAAYYDAGAETDYEDAGQTAEEEAVQVVEFYGTGEEYERTIAGSSISFLSADDVYGHLANKRFRESTEQVELRYNGSCELYINGEWNAPPFHVVSLQSKQATIMYNSPMDGTMRLIVRIEGRDIEVQDPIDGTVYYQVKLRRY